MFKKDKKPIDLEIQRVIGSLSTMEADKPEYTAMVKNLETLHKSKSYKTDDSVSKEVIITCATSLAQILAILYFEKVQFGVVSSKAIGFVVRLLK